MKKIPDFLLSVRFSSAMALVAVALAGCHPAPTKADSDNAAALRDAGYSVPPIVTAVTQGGPGTIIADGQALPDGRVRFLYGQDRAIGVTADSKGHFSAELPASPQGSVFDLSMEDSGRLTRAEGRLFVPPGQPAKSVIMRPGAPSVPVYSPTPGLAVADYDAAGALAVSGRVAPKTAIDLIVDGEIRAQPISDARGFFSAMTQIPPPGDAPMTVHLSVEAAGSTWRRDIDVSKAADDAADVVTPTPEGWRIDWRLPGGGVQTTLVF